MEINVNWKVITKLKFTSVNYSFLAGKSVGKSFRNQRKNLTITGSSFKICLTKKTSAFQAYEKKLSKWTTSQIHNVNVMLRPCLTEFLIPVSYFIQVLKIQLTGFHNLPSKYKIHLFLVDFIQLFFIFRLLEVFFLAPCFKLDVFNIHEFFHLWQILCLFFIFSLNNIQEIEFQ